MWARPLFTVFYAVPALGGYALAKLFTVLIAALVAWQSFKLAQQLALEHAPLVIPLLYLQPSFFVLCADTMTEPLFALVLVAALRLRYAKKTIASSVLVSFSVLARPEGLFICALWAMFALKDWWTNRKTEQGIARTLLAIALLATGVIVWWLAALIITRDPLFIVHNWPPSWPTTGTIYGHGKWWNYFARFAEIVPPLLIPAFVIGMRALASRTAAGIELIVIFVAFFVIHTILRMFGLMGSAGYPRYFVAISPVLALITLCGWNQIALRMSRLTRSITMAAIIVLSAIICFCYFDGAEWIRDTKAVNEMARLSSARGLDQSNRFVWSQAYAAIRFDTDPWKNITFTPDHERNIELLRASQQGTLVLWESRYGPIWHHVNPEDFQQAGYDLIEKREFLLKGYVLPRSFFGFGGPRHQEMYLYYKK